MLKITLRTALVPLAATMGLVATASAAGFDFENLAASYSGSGARPGVYSSVSQTADGVTLTVTRTGGAAFDVFGYAEAPNPGDAYAGRRWLDGFNVRDDRPFVLDFDQNLSAFSLFMGQFTAAAPRGAILRAYSGVGGTGSLLSTANGTIPIVGTGTGTSSALAGVVLTVSGTSIRSVVASIDRASATSSYNGFIDNGAATVQAVPEPSLLAALGLGAVAGLRRRKRA